MTRLNKPSLALAALVEVACSLGSYDYLSVEYSAPGAEGGTGGAGADGGSAATATGEAGAGEVVDACQDLSDGSPCDDEDVCTLSSLCVDGSCQGGGDHPCTVADSVHEFSTTQGLQGFWYGAWLAGSDTDHAYDPDIDFQELAPCPDQTWQRACVPEADAAFRWTRLSPDLAHAATEPALDLPVRRWLSDVSGQAMARIDHHHADPGDGDGTRAMLLVDGAAVWENEISGSDAAGTQVELPVRLQVGTRVELVLHPRSNQARDMTYLSLVLSGQ